jgi:hypothetical protein
MVLMIHTGLQVSWILWNPLTVKQSSKILSFSLVHNLALKCLSGSPFGEPTAEYSTIHERSQQIKEFEPLLNIFPRHQHSSERGIHYCPEYMFTDYFRNKSDYFFGPFVPVFVNWLWARFQISRDQVGRKPLADILSMIGNRYLMITRTWIECGIDTWPGVELNEEVPSNLLLFGSSEYSHIVLPYNLQDLSPLKMLKPKKRIIFSGTNRNYIRVRIKNKLQNIFPKEVFPDYIKDFPQHFRFISIIISPLGAVRNCYRTIELWQMGMIPWIIQDEHLVVPYWNSTVKMNHIMFFADYHQTTNTVQLLNSITEKNLSLMRKAVLRYRESHFRNGGVLDQIQRFMLTGYEDSDLRCTKYFRGYIHRTKKKVPI